MQIVTKTHQISPFKKNSWGSSPRTPLAIRMAMPCATRRFTTCKFPNVQKNLAPLPNPGYAPALSKSVNDFELFLLEQI